MTQMHHEAHFTKINIVILTSWQLLSQPCFALGKEIETSLNLLVIIGGLLIIQTILIAGLQRSRLKNKAAKNLLKLHQKELEDKIKKMEEAAKLKETKELQEKEKEFYRQAEQKAIEEEARRKEKEEAEEREKSLLQKL